MEEKFKTWLLNKGKPYANKYHIISLSITFLYDDEGMGAKQGDYTDKDVMGIVDKLFPILEQFRKE